MKRDWDKAVKMLKEIGGDRPTHLSVEIWPSGMKDERYQRLSYKAYILSNPGDGISASGNSAVEAVENLKNVMEERGVK